MNLWLDDLRDPNRFGHVGWTWAKTIAEAQVHLQTGLVDRSSLDHDLGFSYGDDPTKPSWSPTGYDLCVWMQATGNWPNERPTVHSMNPIGSKRIRDFIEQRWRPPPCVIREVPTDEFGRVDMRALFS